MQDTISSKTTTINNLKKTPVRDDIKRASTTLIVCAWIVTAIFVWITFTEIAFGSSSVVIIIISVVLLLSTLYLTAGIPLRYSLTRKTYLEKLDAENSERIKLMQSDLTKLKEELTEFEKTSKKTEFLGFLADFRNKSGEKVYDKYILELSEKKVDLENQIKQAEANLKNAEESAKFHQDARKYPSFYASLGYRDSSVISSTVDGHHVSIISETARDREAQQDDENICSCKQKLDSIKDKLLPFAHLELLDIAGVISANEEKKFLEAEAKRRALEEENEAKQIKKYDENGFEID